MRTSGRLQMPTQKEQILKLLQSRGQTGIMVYEIIAPKPNGLGIAQYNARIKDLREEGHNIVNTTPGHFVLKSAKTNCSPTPEKTKLSDDAMKTWDQMGAFLRGEGPRPETDSQFKEIVQGALI